MTIIIYIAVIICYNRVYFGMKDRLKSVGIFLNLTVY
nr:MAG TPA: hypothetical protein [Caudoviricetes sp.]